MHVSVTVTNLRRYAANVVVKRRLKDTNILPNQSLNCRFSLASCGFEKRRGCVGSGAVKETLPLPRLIGFLTEVSRRCCSWEPAAGCVARSAATMEPEAGSSATPTDGAKESAKRKSDEAEDAEAGARGKRRRGAGGKKLRPGERYVPPPQKRNPVVSFSQEHFAETSYYFEGGLRKVRPYYFDFKTYCKGRWVGKSLLEVFENEFRAESIEYYQEAAKEGRIRLNDAPIEDLSVVLKNNDLMRNRVHRHEPPVVGTPLEVLVDDGQVLVVDKPASIPVHPCGRFRHNSVIFILGKERGLTQLHTVHRLDRLTSGVLLFARTLETSKKLNQLVRDRQLEKEYVCRVEGEFPEGELVCEEPILTVSFKVGLCCVSPKGKESRTVFRRLAFNGRSSLVRCLPLTGRTHQIRVHLQYLGFPILNDPIYGSWAWGPQRGKGGLLGKSDAELLQALVEQHQAQEAPGGHASPKSSGADADADAGGAADRDHLCSECRLVRADPTQSELVMYLHALRYKGPDFEYSTPLPDWAREDWVQPQ